MPDSPQSPSLLATIRSMPPTLYTIGAAAFINRSGGFLAIFGSIYLTSLAISKEQVVLVLTAAGVLGMLGSIGSGHLADRFSPKTILVLSSLANAAALALLATGPSLIISIIVTIAASALTQVFLPPAAATVAMLATSLPQRTPFFALYRIFLNIGSISSPLIATLVGETQFSRLFLYSAIANLIVVVILLTGVRVHAPPTIRLTTARTRGELRTSPRTRVAFPLFIVFAVVAGIYAQYQSTLPLQIRDIHGSLGIYSGLILLNSALILFTALPISGITRRLPLYVPLAMGALMMALGVSLSGLFAGTTALLFVFAAVFTLGENIFGPISNAAATALAPPGRVATYQGYLGSVQVLGITLGPAIGVAGYFQLAAGVWLVIIGVGAACSALFIVLLRHNLAARPGPQHE
ncbi:MFS transporter [Lysinibacter sp. HNR]|uniref:MFS transporter n=1 Tax=Lysinibacter sp. HNR TaxID=3031408 RepID=UPI00243585C7|nr:MFS transporter [Lysinibacter sp. HNR]WGD37095.1 MFS transporter [Lysinibacter sp. HNR]